MPRGPGVKRGNSDRNFHTHAFLNENLVRRSAVAGEQQVESDQRPVSGFDARFAWSWMSR